MTQTNISPGSEKRSHVTEMLMRGILYRRPLRHYLIQCCFQKLHIVHLCPAGDYRQRDSISVDQQAALGPIFFPDPWGSAPQILVLMEPLPWPRLRFATPKLPPPSRRTPPTPFATGGRKRLCVSNPGSTCGSSWHSQTVLPEEPSTGILFAIHIQCLQTRGGVPSVCVPRLVAADISDLFRVYVPESAAPLLPIVHPKPSRNVL